MKIYGIDINSLKQQDFVGENLGECNFPSPLELESSAFYSESRILFNNRLDANGEFGNQAVFSFEGVGPHPKIFFDPSRINVGIVTCGGLCPGLNDVIRSVTYSCLENYKVKNVYGFRYGYQGLTAEHSHEAISLTSEHVDDIHEVGGTLLGSSRGQQSIDDMVDTLVKFNISILFVIGGDGTQRGSMAIVKEINRRKLKIAVMGIPKTIDNDIAFLHKSFGFDTAVEEARKVIYAGHVEAKGAQNGIGLVKLMGRHSGFIAAHATIASGNVNICLIPEVPVGLDELYARLKRRFERSDHAVIVVAEGFGQELIEQEMGEKQEFDKSGNVKLRDIGHFLKDKLHERLEADKVEHTIKYIDPSYMIRSTPSNAIDSSFCLNLGNNAVHAAMAGRTNVLMGYWNQHFCLVPIALALSARKMVDVNSYLWRSIVEITQK